MAKVVQKDSTEIVCGTCHSTLEITADDLRTCPANLHGWIPTVQVVVECPVCEKHGGKFVVLEMSDIRVLGFGSHDMANFPEVKNGL
jgi:hypothetical protein